MSGPGHYKPAGGWSGDVLADAPAAVPVPVPVPVPAAVPEPEPATPPGPQGPQGPSFLALIGGLLVARLVVEVTLAVLFLYVFALILASNASFGDTGTAIFINLVLVLASLPVSRAVLQVVIGWRTALVPLAIALLLGLAVRFTAGLLELPVALGVLASLPLQAIVLLSISDSFSSHTSAPGSALDTD
jgi:hypothetical protein